MATELDRESKVLIYVIGTLCELRDKGFVGGGLDLAEAGQAEFAALKASGFRPTEDEIRRAMQDAHPERRVMRNAPWCGEPKPQPGDGQ